MSMPDKSNPYGSPRKIRLTVAPVALMIILTTSPAWAYSPLLKPDDQIAGQADLIVVGRIKTGSVEYVPHDEKRDGITIRGFVPRARLVIKRVAYGKLEDSEIYIWFRGGALPLVEGRFHWNYGKPGADRRLDMRRKKMQFPPDSVQIGELNNSFYFREQFKNLCNDHVWFLKRHKGLPGLKPDKQAWCIDSYFYVNNSETADYFVAYRAADPRKALLAQLPNYPDRADTIRGFVDYLDAIKASQIKDPAQRVEALLPYLFHGELLDSDGKAFWRWNSAPYVAREGLIAAGEPAARLLAKKLAERTDTAARCRIIEAIGEIKYRPATDALDELLEKQNDAWAKIKAGTFDPSDESPGNQRMVQSFREIRILVEALARLADPRSRRVLGTTLKISTALQFGGIASSCEQTIGQIDAAAEKSDDAVKQGAPKSR